MRGASTQIKATGQKGVSQYSLQRQFEVVDDNVNGFGESVVGLVETATVEKELVLVRDQLRLYSRGGIGNGLGAVFAEQRQPRDTIVNDFGTDEGFEGWCGYERLVGDGGTGFYR